MYNPIAIEVKQEILSKIRAGEKILELARHYGISEKTIYNWLRKKAIGTVSLLEHNRLRKENEQMKEIIGVLTVELTKLKKKR